MDHHIVTDVDTHMADTGGIIRSGEKHQIARLDVGRGYRLSLIHISSMKLRIIHELCQGLEIDLSSFFASPLFDENNLEP